MATLVVTYSLTAEARFDADYYLATHIPLVREKWAPFGLIEAIVHLPDQPKPAYAAVAVLRFRDKDAITAALGSPEARAVFGDVPNFTDIAPQPMIARIA